MLHPFIPITKKLLIMPPLQLVGSLVGLFIDSFVHLFVGLVGWFVRLFLGILEYVRRILFEFLTASMSFSSFYTENQHAIS